MGLIVCPNIGGHDPAMKLAARLARAAAGHKVRVATDSLQGALAAGLSPQNLHRWHGDDHSRDRDRQLSAGGDRGRHRPTPEPADGGLKLLTGPATTPNAAAPLALGQAQNPPTASTQQTLTALLNGAGAASTKHRKKAKPVVITTGATTVPAGKTVSLTLTLTAAARRDLRKHRSLKATETIVAKDSAGQTQTTTRIVTIRLQ